MAPLGSGMDDTVNALAWDGNNDTLYAGGKFPNAGGVANTNYIARWDGSSWHALGNGMNFDVNALAWDGSNLYAGGGFSSAGGVPNTKHIARWDGSSWNPLGSGMSGGDTVIALAWDGSNLYAGGQFNSAGDVADTKHIASWDGSSWQPLSDGSGSGMSSTVNALAWDGRYLYAGGSFTSAGGVAASRIARWDGSSWHSLGSGMNSTVNALAWDGSKLYAGGSFTSAGGVAGTSYIARWDGSSWQPLGSGMNGIVYALAWDGSDLYAGGNFSSAGGVAANRIARWDGSSWHPLGSGISGTVGALAWDGSNLYAGGGFSSAGGVANTNRIARWDGSSWYPLGSGIGNESLSSSVSALAWNGENLYVGGSFYSAGGVTNTAYIARWDGSSWHSFGSGVSSSVSALAWDGSNLYVGGGFTSAGGVGTSRIARWDGSSWHPLGSGMNNTVNALAWDGSSLYAGGSFTTAGQTASSILPNGTTPSRRPKPPPVPYAVAEGSSTPLDASATTDPNQDASTLTYEWDFDGDGSYDDATGITPSFSAATLDGPSSVTIGLKVSNDAGGSDTTTATVNVSNVAPTISSVTNDGPVDEGNSVTVSVTASDVAGAADPLNYEFDCDNNGSYEVGPQTASSTSCTLSSSGSVNVRVTDGDSGEATDATTVTVNNLDPTISSVSSNLGTVAEGGSVTITVSASDADSLSYEFDCDNDGDYEVGPQASSSTDCTVGNNGTAQINVRVTDGDGGEATDSTSVTVINANPTINSVSNDGPIDEGNNATITVDASDVDALSYEFDCDDDNNYEVGPQASSSTSCFFSDQTGGGADGAPLAPATLSGRVNVRVTDGDGGEATDYTFVTVNNADPTISSVSNGGPVDEFGSVTISVTASDPAGTADTLSYEFDCDNDNSYEIGPQAESSTSCTMGDNGSAQVNVRVSDEDGGETTDSTTVTVNNVAPTISSVTNDGPVDEGSSVTISVTASDPAGKADPLRYEFDCDNDGDYEVGPQTSSSTSCTPSSSGSVNVRVTDGDGGEATDATTVSVNNLDPVINSVSNDGPINEGNNVTITVDASDVDTLSYEFDCDGNGDYEVGPQASSSTSCYFGDQTEGEPLGANLAPVTLSGRVNVRVTDGDGGEATDTTTVTVNNVNPTISSVSNDGPIDEGNNVTITVTASDPAGANDPLNYEFDCDGDGDYEVGPQSENSTSCFFSDQTGGEPGGALLAPATLSGRVNVRVTDGDGGEATDYTYVSVNNADPTISSVSNGGPVDEFGSVTISVSASDPAGTADTLSYEFD
ncbi:MAG: hypothetical protein R3C62_12210 [Chloroflexota bacterium]